jgi:signal transduction histidine kinase
LKRSIRIAWLIFALSIAALAMGIQNQWKQSTVLSRTQFIEANHAQTLAQIDKLEIALSSVYQNIRTLAQLPSVRSIDRHATNLSDEARITFQQIYNNLASSVDVSEVYIVPIDLDPDKIDVVTSKTEVPILMFDELILNAGSIQKLGQHKKPEDGADFSGPIEVESFEYKELVEQAKWFKANFPRNDSSQSFEVPFIAGHEVITCDNTRFIKTKNDSDRKGTLFTVPFYDQNGNIRGMISATMLTSALRDLLPSPYMGLVNPGNNYASLGTNLETLSQSSEAIASAQQDPSLIYSEAIALPIKDSRSPWFVWSGLPNDVFENSTSTTAANEIRRDNFISLALLGLVVGISIFLLQRYLAKSDALNVSLANSKLLAERAEAEANVSAEQFRTMHDDIARLNNELNDNLKRLTEAQEDIVRKGKMAQLGSLVATVAHELRNPLGGVRTTAFMLKRKLKNSTIDVKPQLDRIESGVSRCDHIINQLLDFSRSSTLQVADVNLCAWLQTLLQEEIVKYPESIAVNCILDDDIMMAQVDTERLRRGVINLMSNAAEAMTTRKDQDAAPNGHEISIKLTRSQRGIEIRVSDNGPGIAPENLAKIGEPLFTTKSFGTGLGIAAVQKIAELHNGGLDVSSEMGKGACFTIWFPRHQPQTRAA